jgi:2-oxoglutarate ferredoxin oxidoreductase subunit alpha
MNEPILNIVIGGEAGQGLVTIGQLLSKSLVRSGYHLAVTQSYQSRIRGGHNTFAIRVSRAEVEAPQDAIDLLIALNEETVNLHLAELSAGGLVVADAGVKPSLDRWLAVPYAELGSGRALNIIALGVAGALLGLDPGLVEGAVDAFFGHKHPDAAAENQKALSQTYAWCQGKYMDAFQLPRPEAGKRRVVMNGNEAIAMGALSAGVKLCSFYPMTPSTSVPLTLAAQAGRMGLVVEQAEDEIAAINMALGASYAGAPSMVSTSGGGFALMIEGVSLSGMTETPIVIVVAQRPGPATGLPTRTAQQDLEMVLHAGHGEFPRAIYAPGTIEECFHLTRKAFFTAQKSQTPVFILTDQFLADSYRAVKPFEVESLEAVRPAENVQPVALPYQRYALTESGVSPRLIPGLSPHLVVADSDEHTEDGHLTEDLAVAVAMNDKRRRKERVLRQEVVAPTYVGADDAEVLFVCWGSLRGAVFEASSRLAAEKNRKTGVLHFAQVWPLEPSQFLDRLERARTVVAVEGNASGQLARLIRRETGFHIVGRVNRYDGLPMTADFILSSLAAV